MRKLYLLFLLLSTNLSFAQDNFVPADSAVTWHGRADHVWFKNWAGMYVPETDYDTIIGAHTYTKLYAEESYYLCAFRSDLTEKILYFVPKDSTSEYEFFDFDAGYAVGDTIFNMPIHAYMNAESFHTYDYIVEQFDSIDITGTYYKKWSLIAVPPHSDEVAHGFDVTERLISSNGFPFVANYTFETAYILKCYSELDTFVYGDKCPYDLDYWNSTLELLPEPISEMKIYPNPVQDNIQIDFKEEVESGVVSIRSVSGKEVIRESINEKSSMTIELSDLSMGVYVIEIRDGQQVLCRKKITKQ